MPIRQLKLILLILIVGLQYGLAAAQGQDEIAFYVSLNLKGERAETWWPRLLEGSWAAEFVEADPEELPSIFEPKVSLVAGPTRGIAQVALKQPDRVEKALAKQELPSEITGAEVRGHTLFLYFGEPIDPNLWKKQRLAQMLPPDHDLALFVDPGTFSLTFPEEMMELFRTEREGEIAAKLERLDDVPPILIAVTGEHLEVWLDSEVVAPGETAWSFDGGWLDKNVWTRLSRWRDAREQAFQAMAGLNMSLPLHMRLWISVTEPIDRLGSSPLWTARPDDPAFARRAEDGDSLSLPHWLLADAFRNRRPHTGPFEETLEISDDGIWHYTLDSSRTGLVEQELAVEWGDLPAKPAPAAEACRENLTNIGTALEMYSVDFRTYPESMEPLTPNYLPTVPVCPTGGAEYFYEKSDEGGYRLHCPEHG